MKESPILFNSSWAISNRIYVFYPGMSTTLEDELRLGIRDQLVNYIGCQLGYSFIIEDLEEEASRMAREKEKD